MGSNLGSLGVRGSVVRDSASPSLRWGLPYLFHPDEPTNFNVVLRMLKQHDPNPHFFHYPSLFFYANALVQLAHYAVSRVAGGVHALSDLPNLDMPTGGGGLTLQPSTFVVARLLSMACGLATVWLAYRIGRVLSKDPRVGLLAALLVAVSPSVLRDSRWMAPDGMVMLTVTATLLASLSALGSGHWKHYLWASRLDRTHGVLEVQRRTRGVDRVRGRIASRWAALVPEPLAVCGAVCRPRGVLADLTVRGARFPPILARLHE